MDGPFFVVETGNELLVFANKHDLENGLEAIDVRNGEYRLFTEDGTELQLSTDDLNVVVVQKELGKFPDILAKALRKRLQALRPGHETIDKNAIPTAPLSALAAAALRAHLKPKKE